MDILLGIIVLLVATFPFIGRKFYSKKNIYGILLSFTVGVPAFYLGKAISVVGGPVFGILLGILVGLLRFPEKFKPGIQASSKKILQAAIVLFGFQMNLKHVMNVGGQSLLLMAFTISASFLTAYFVSKALKVEPKAATLIGVGTAICGGSAIAAAAPVIRANDEEVASSISTIFLFNVMAVFVFPFLGRSIGLSDTGFGMWAGTAVNDTSSVLAAAYSYSEVAGNLATIVKLTRTLMIVPVTFVLALYTASKTKASETSFNIIRIFPWFVVGFIIACVVNTFGFVPTNMSSFLGSAGKFLIVIAMAAIGLNTNLVRLISNGKKSILLGAICWFAVAVSSLVVQSVLKLL